MKKSTLLAFAFCCFSFALLIIKCNGQGEDKPVRMFDTLGYLRTIILGGNGHDPVAFLPDNSYVIEARQIGKGQGDLFFFFGEGGYLSTSQGYFVAEYMQNMNGDRFRVTFGSMWWREVPTIFVKVSCATYKIRYFTLLTTLKNTL